MKRISLRDAVFYILIFLVLVSTVMALQNLESTGDSTYADLRTLFEQEQVISFEAEEDEVSLVLRELDENGKPRTAVFPIANFSVFYNDMHELIDRQWKAGIIEDYDYPQGFVWPWWISFVPYIVIFLVFGLLWYFMFMRQSGGGGNGGNNPARFGKARTRTLDEGSKKVSFDDVGGRRRGKGRVRGDRRIPERSSEVYRLGRPHPQGCPAGGPSGHR